MRNRAVAGEGVHVDGTWAAVIAVAGSAFGAVMLWLGQRLIGRAAFEEMITKRVALLIDQLQEERVEYQKTVHSLREELSTERRARNDERIVTSAERAQLRGEIVNLTQALESLKGLLRRNGIEIPQSPPTPPIALLELHAPDADQA